MFDLYSNNKNSGNCWTVEHCYSIIIIPDRITFTPTRELRVGVKETFTPSRLYSHGRVKETFTPSRKLRVGMGLTLIQ